MAQKDTMESRSGKPVAGPAPERHHAAKDRSTDSGFLPYASEPQDVARLLSEYIAQLREASFDSVFSTYNGLESGFQLVFKRELCLKHDDLTPNDQRGKRSLLLDDHRRLVKAVTSCDEALKILARVLEKGRVQAVKSANKAEKGMHVTKPLAIDLSKLIANAKQSARQDIVLSDSEHRMVASWETPLYISFQNLQEIRSLKDLHTQQRLGLKHPMRSCAFLGGGGGSDVIQAASMAKLLVRANPVMKVPAVISIRTLYSKSTSAGEKRSVWHVDDKAGGKHNLLDNAKGDLKIELCHLGNARFVEDAIAGEFSNVRLVIDDKSQDHLRRPRYERAVGDDVDSMVIMDTGGDVLGGMDPLAKKKTPDQDCRTQIATAQIAAAKSLSSIVAIAALGVDAPADTQSKLEASNAVYYRFTAEDKHYLAGLYSTWHFDGSPANLYKYPEHYGKTPFAMLASFNLGRGESGFHALPLPESVINDFNNPWACITWITPEMSYLVLVNQAKLLSVIAPPEKN
jgi:hypothetical protein